MCEREIEPCPECGGTEWSTASDGLGAVASVGAVSELTEVRFWAQVIGDAKRTIVCNPDLESRIKTWIDARNMGGILRVELSPHCPMDRVFVIDEQAIQATVNRPMRFTLRY